METTRVIVAIGYFILEYKANKKRQVRERKFIDWMNGRGPYPEDEP